MLASPCIMPSNPTQSMSQLQALHGNGVMSWILCVPTRRLDTKHHHASCMACDNETRCFAFPQTATALGKMCMCRF